MCDFCKDIGTEEKALLTHEMEIGNGNICEYGETAYMEIHNCPMCGHNL